jgi:hypothetical protein
MPVCMRGLATPSCHVSYSASMYRQTQSVLDDESRLALAPRVLPAFD